MAETDIKSFILKNILSSTSELMLKYGKDKNLKFAISQIAARQKIKDKLPTLYNNLDFVFPDTIPLEQASSEITAEYKSNIIRFESSCDLTGGMGIDSYYISKKSKHHIYIEQNQHLERIFSSNIKTLGLSNVESINVNSLDYILKCEDLPDFIYLDPARRGAAGQKTYFLEDTEPNPIAVLDIVHDKFTYILIKTSPMLDISRAISQLKYVKEVHIVSVKNECKELLFLLERKYTGSIRFVTVNFGNSNNKQTVEFVDNEGILEFSSPKTYLYEANTSISKLGFWKSFGYRYNLSALDSNTHLFTSNEIINNFPGRSFHILNITKISKKEISKLIPDKKANISIKNVPISIDDFKKKTALKEGGDIYIFVAKAKDLGNVCLMCKKLG